MTETKKFKFHGNGREIFLIVAKNLVLTVITFGLYYPWGKCNLRSYLWSHSEFDGHRFEFIGKGSELLQAYIKAAGVYYILMNLTSLSNNEQISHILLFVSLLTGLLITPFVIWGSSSYRASRTTYRGIKFSLDQSRKSEFISSFLRDICWSFCTFGLYLPIALFNVHKNIINATKFGDNHFCQNGEPADEWIITASNWFLNIITIFIYSPWAKVRKMKYRLSKTSIQNMTFKLNLKGSELALIIIGTTLGSILTLGLAVPWAKSYTLAKILSSLDIEGELDYSAIEKSHVTMDVDGEATSDLFDIDASGF